jgi:hypothetical protein
MRRTIGALAAALLLLPDLGRAEAGRTAVPFLTLPVGARSAALGGAVTAVAGGVESLFYNPAGLTAAERPAVSATVASGLVDDGFGSVSAVAPSPLGTFAAGAMYLNGGQIDLNLSSGFQSTKTAEQDTAVLGAWALRLPGGFSVGAAGKWIQSQLVETYTARTSAIDAGILWDTPLEGLALGGAVQNIGNDVKFEQQGDPLPLTYRGGLAYRHELDEITSITISADGIQTLDEDFRESVGLDVTSRKEGNAYSFRAGYQFQRDEDGLALGIGAAFKHLSIDYAYSFSNDFHGAHRFSLGCRF